MTLLSETTESAIAITFLVMNLSTLLKEVLSLLLCFSVKKEEERISGPSLGRPATNCVKEIKKTTAVR